MCEADSILMDLDYHFGELFSAASALFYNYTVSVHVYIIYMQCLLAFSVYHLLRPGVLVSISDSI